MKKIYKIAFLLPNLESQGGVTVSVQTISYYLASLGHEVHLYPIGKTTQKETTSIHPINTNKKSEQLKQIKRLFKKQQQNKSFDLVVSNNLITNYLLHHLDVGDKRFMILRQPSLLKKKNRFSLFKKRFTFPKIYNNKNIVMISQCLQDDFLKRFSYLKPKTTRVIYNAFDKEKIEKKANEPIVVPQKPYIISVGRFTKTKNQSMLINAFKKIQDQSIELILLGEGKDERYLKQLVKRHDLEDRVHFIGWQENPYPWIKHARLLVHTSKSETFGRVILEGLALDTPVVCTDIKCGPNEILTNDLNPFLVPIHDLTKLTQAIDQALLEYPKITTQHLEKFYIEHISNHYITFIES